MGFWEQLAQELVGLGVIGIILFMGTVFYVGMMSESWGHDNPIGIVVTKVCLTIITLILAGATLIAGFQFCGNIYNLLTGA